MTRKIACLTLDMEPDYGDPDGRIRLLENPFFFERYIEIINKYSAKVTHWSTPLIHTTMIHTMPLAGMK